MTELTSIKQILSQLKPELKQKYFVNTIGLFGSIVRNDFNEKSDVDIIVDFSRPIGIEFIDLADYIESRLSKKVDLVSRNEIKTKYFHQIESDIIYVKREPSLPVEDIIDSTAKILDYTLNLSFEEFTRIVKQ